MAKRLRILNLGRLSGPVIGVAGKNRRRPIELLGKDDTGEPVRQGHGPERQNPACFSQRLPRQTVGPANQEGDPLRTVVAELRQEFGKSFA